MQLWYATTSPFARKVRVAAHELGLAEGMELVRVDPWSDERLRALNPLAKVPTLALLDGDVLYESGVICDWLDARSGARRLFPADGPSRWRALRLQGLADGAMTAAGRLFADERRSETERSDAMMRRLADALGAALDGLADDLTPGVITIGEISAACLLGYLDFRWPDRDWRSGREVLAQWFLDMEARPSLRATLHHLQGPNPSGPSS